MFRISAFPGTLKAILETLGTSTKHKSSPLIKRWSNWEIQPGRSPCEEARTQAGSARSRRVSVWFKVTRAKADGSAVCRSHAPAPAQRADSALSAALPRRWAPKWHRVRFDSNRALSAICLRSPFPHGGRAEYAKLGLNVLFVQGAMSSRCPLIMVVSMQTLCWKCF